MPPPNPVAESQETPNPYAAPNAVGPTKLGSQSLFLPATILLVVSAFWALYMLMALAMILSPQGLFREEGQEFIWVSSLAGYCVMLLTSIISAAGTISMLRMRTKWLAWTACILALVPMFGPCMGLTIPLGIWALVILRRPEVDASFRS